MLVNNMQAVLKVFFRKIKITRMEDCKNVELNLSKLSKDKIVASRIRADSKVK